MRQADRDRVAGNNTNRLKKFQASSDRRMLCNAKPTAKTLFDPDFSSKHNKFFFGVSAYGVSYSMEGRKKSKKIHTASFDDNNVCACVCVNTHSLHENKEEENKNVFVSLG